MNQRSANAKLTDVEYDLVKDLLLCGSFKGGNRPNNRLFIDAVLYVAKTGCGWRQLPPEYGKWNSVWRRFNRFSESNIWEKVFNDLKSKNEEIVAIDSTSIIVHQESMMYIKKLKNRAKTIPNQPIIFKA
jgi:transposase